MTAPQPLTPDRVYPNLTPDQQRRMVNLVHGGRLGAMDSDEVFDRLIAVIEEPRQPLPDSDLAGLRDAVRQVLVTWERYFDSETDEGRRAYWTPLATAMDELNAVGFDLAMFRGVSVTAACVGPTGERSYLAHDWNADRTACHRCGVSVTPAMDAEQRIQRLYTTLRFSIENASLMPRNTDVVTWAAIKAAFVKDDEEARQ